MMTHLGSHNVRLIVDEKVESQTSLSQRRAASEAQALEHFRVIDYGLAKREKETDGRFRTREGGVRTHKHYRTG